MLYYHSFQSAEHESIEKFDQLPPGSKDYVEQLEMMVQNDRSTLYVDFFHIELSNQNLGEAIQTQYYK